MMRSRPGVISWCGRTVCIFAFLPVLLTLSACDPPGKPKAQPTENTRNITDFKTLFAENCQGCHGAEGLGGPGRPLNNALYLAIVPKDEISKVIANGRQGTGMPAWAISQGGPLTDQQVAALVDGIEKNWAKPVDFHGAATPAYSADVSTGNPDKGRKLFLRDCFACHGQGAPIGPVADPTYLSLVSNQLLRTAVIEGWPSLGMPNYQTLNLGHALASQDITDIVAFLASKRPVNPNVQELHTNENGTGQSGSMVKGNEGSGVGPGSPHQQEQEGSKARGSSQQGVGAAGGKKQ
ncbi:MAG TPA: cytochrome c [Bryobacteraceae bacterium]|nr:cytochrome c [Bryobacteraceae bacterium]